MSRFEPEARATKPTEFDPWVTELGLFADCEGEAAMLGILIEHAPAECVQYLGSQQPMWAELIARARHGDRCRFAFGVYVGWLARVP